MSKLSGVLLIVVLTGFAYAPSLRGQFLLDDDALITKNPLIRSTSSPAPFWFTTKAPDYWPVTSTSFWIEWRLWGFNTLGYHVVNVALHVAAALLIWMILQKLAIPGAFLAALLFAVHPVNVESVAWISQRKNTLAMVFFLLSILWYLRTEERRNRPNIWTESTTLFNMSGWYWLSLFAFVLAMLSKGSVAILPLVLLGLVWWQQRRIGVHDLVRTLPFFAVAVVLTTVDIWFQTHGKSTVVLNLSFLQRMAGAGEVIWFYLAKALLPIRLAFVYPQWKIQAHELLWWLPLVSAVAVTFALWQQRAAADGKWGRAMLFAWVFFCVALVPVLGFTDVGYMQFSPVADHYQHIAIIGVTALVAAGFSFWQRRALPSARWAAQIAAAALVGALTLLTWNQNRLYADPITLYTATLQQNPDCWMAHLNLGNALLVNGQMQEAVNHFEEALRLKPDYAEAHYNLGNCAAQAGRMELAIAQYREALQIDPEDARAYNNLGAALFQTGHTAEAIEQYQLALVIHPDYAEAHGNFGAALSESKRFLEAMGQLQEAVQLKPDFTKAWMDLALVYASLQQPEKAVHSAETAARLANSQKQWGMEKQIEDWLTKYRGAANDDREKLPDSPSSRSAP